MTPLIATLGLLTAGPIDKWELKNDVAKGSSTYAITVEVEMNGEQLQAKLTMLREVESSDDKGAKVKFTWKDIEVGGNPVGEDKSFPTTTTLRNAITKSSGEFGDDERRMLSTITFVYPETGVDVGDKWSFENKPEGGALHTATFEVKAVEKVGDQDAMKIAVKMDEKEETGIHTTGHFWVSKTGKVLKWDINAKHWVVPMAGPPMDAHIIGSVVPAK